MRRLPGQRGGKLDRAQAVEVGRAEAQKKLLDSSPLDRMDATRPRRMNDDARQPDLALEIGDILDRAQADDLEFTARGPGKATVEVTSGGERRADAAGCANAKRARVNAAGQA